MMYILIVRFPYENANVYKAAGGGEMRRLVRKFKSEGAEVEVWNGNLITDPENP